MSANSKKDVLLRNAIQTKRKLRASYNGEDERIIEPFCYGRSALDKDKDLLRAYQDEGFSESEESKGWKLFFVEDLSLKLMNEHFKGIRKNYNPKSETDDAMDKVYCKVNGICTQQ